MRCCEDEVAEMRKEYDGRRKYFVKALNDIGLFCFEPFGVFYVFPDISSSSNSSVVFCTQLLKKENAAICIYTAIKYEPIYFESICKSKFIISNTE
ncbi:MAG: aminotransferase class I/II-fold pyridoxal phosphate-dependent enzyme [Mycoplasma sp.]